MPRELVLFDTFIPSLLFIFIVSFIVQALVHRLSKRSDLYAWVWHPPLFRSSLFVCLFSSLSLLMLR